MYTPSQAVAEMVELSAAYEKAVQQETELTAEQLVVATVGKMVRCCITLHHVDASLLPPPSSLALLRAHKHACSPDGCPPPPRTPRSASRRT